MGADLEQVFRNALTIDEVLHIPGKYFNQKKNYSPFGADEVLKAWCQASCAGDWSHFDMRLARENLSASDIKYRFDAEIEINEYTKTRWMIDFEWIIELLLEAPKIDHKKFGIEHIPFGELFLQLALDCCSKVKSQLAESTEQLIDTQTFSNLVADLIKQFSDLTHKLLYNEFSEFRSLRYSVDSHNSDEKQTLIYDDFVYHLRDGGMHDLIKRYPVLARLLSIIVRHWIDSNIELLSRLTDDLNAIQTILNKNREVGILVAIEGGFSDPHNSGRTVQILWFNSGFRCLYKPKKCTLDFKWQRLIKKINSDDAPILLKAPIIIDRQVYGWSEYIDNNPCLSIEDVDLYYRRSGALTCLLFLLSASDIHYENIIACGDYPVPIDMEMILQETDPSPDEDVAKELSASKIASELCQRSVLSVGMLPLYDTTVDNKILAVGGMNFMDNDVLDEGYTDINTDQMRPVVNRVTTTHPKNVPMLHGEVKRLKEHLATFINGFRDFSRYILNFNDYNRAEFILHDFKGLTSRRVVKPTRFYYALRKRLLNPEKWTSGFLWSAQADFVSRFYDVNNSTTETANSERRSLLDLNIPTFSFHSDSGYNESLLRIHKFSNNVVDEQCKLIEASAISLTDYYKNKAESPRETYKHPSTDWAAHFENESYLIAKKLASLAIRAKGSATWIGLDWFGGAEVSRLVPLGYDFYNGTVGISLFLSSFGKHSNDHYYEDLVEDALNPLVHELKSPNAGRFARTMGVGICTGIGSIVYGLTAISQSATNKKYIDHALIAASLLNEGLIDSDKKLDLVGGTAGAIISLLHLYKNTELNWVLDKAIYGGDRLLRLKRVSMKDKKCWIGAGFGDIPLGGFSHGAAGFAYAFAMLYHYTKRDYYYVAASECLDYMNETFADSDWIDYILGDDGEITQRQTIIRTSQWCHGGIGIGLSRLASSNYLVQDADLIHRDLNRAIEASSNFGNRYIDSLCCGAMGEVEFLSQVGSYYSDSIAKEKAKSRLCDVIAQSKINGSYQFGGGSDDYHLSLFRGLTGVGYTILRQLEPSLPNISVFA